MKKNNIDPANKQQGGITDKQDKNAGSGAFQQGAQQDDHYNDGVADGQSHPENVSKEKQNPRTKLSDDRLKKDR